MIKNVEARKSSPPADQAYHRHKQRRAYYRPDDREAFAPDMHEKEMRQIKCVGEPNPDNRADKPQGYRHEAPTAAVPRDCLPNRAANPCYQQKYQQVSQRHRHSPLAAGVPRAGIL